MYSKLSKVQLWIAPKFYSIKLFYMEHFFCSSNISALGHVPVEIQPFEYDVRKTLQKRIKYWKIRKIFSFCLTMKRNTSKYSPLCICLSWRIDFVKYLIFVVVLSIFRSIPERPRQTGNEVKFYILASISKNKNPIDLKLCQYDQCMEAFS